MENSAAPPSTSAKKTDRAEQFVIWLLAKINNDKGTAARLRRADNPATEYQSWELLAAFGVDLTNEHQRLPYAMLSAAMARSKAERNGSLPLGQALAIAYGGNDSDPAQARMRRLLACRGMPELCRVLRPLLTLIDSKQSQPLNYVRLLNQLTRFGKSDDMAQRVKSEWAMEFYRKQEERPALEGTS